VDAGELGFRHLRRERRNEGARVPPWYLYGLWRSSPIAWSTSAAGTWRPPSRCRPRVGGEDEDDDLVLAGYFRNVTWAGLIWFHGGGAGLLLGLLLGCSDLPGKPLFLFPFSVYFSFFLFSICI
jgi:hypothetical protein